MQPSTCAQVIVYSSSESELDSDDEEYIPTSLQTAEITRAVSHVQHCAFLDLRNASSL